MAIYKVFYEESESEVEKCQILEPGGKIQEKPIPGFNFLPFSYSLYTPGSMNSLFCDFFREFWRGILGGCSGLFSGYIERFLKENCQEIKG